MHSRQIILIMKCKFKSNKYTKEQNELKIKTNKKEMNTTIQKQL